MRSVQLILLEALLSFGFENVKHMFKKFDDLTDFETIYELKLERPAMADKWKKDETLGDERLHVSFHF